MKKKVFVVLSIVCMLSVSVLPAFAAGPSKEHIAAEKQDEQSLEKAQQGLEKVGGCLGCKDCKSGYKMGRCTAIVGSAVGVCVETDGALCVAAILEIAEHACCACLPGKLLQDLCNKAKYLEK